MTSIRRNDLSIYNRVADQWWSDEVRWVRTLKNLVPGRLAWFDRYIDWADKDVLDLGCAGGFMAEALASKGARVTGIDPASDAIEAAKSRATLVGQAILLLFSQLRIPAKPSIPVRMGNIVDISACGTTNPNPAAMGETRKFTARPSTQT